MATIYTYYAVTNSNTPYAQGDFRYYYNISSTQNTALNQSTIKVDCYAQVYKELNRNSPDFISSILSWVKIDGVAYTFTKNINLYTLASKSFYLGTITRTVNHNSDGTKGLYVQCASQTTNGWQDYYIYTGNTYISLPTIPRASTVTATNANIGSATSINVNRASSSFTHTLKYTFGSLSGTIATGVGTSYGWTVPTSFYAQIPNAKTGTCTITCETYSGGTLIGTKTTTMTVTASESLCKPDVSATIVDSNTLSSGLTGDPSKFVKYISNAQFVITSTAKNSASITSRKITCGDGKSSTIASGTLNAVESATFTIETTDSRGYKTTSTINKTLLPYVKLTLNASFYRTAPTNNEIALTFSGNYFNATFGEIANTLTLKYKWKVNGATEWEPEVVLTPTLSGNTYSNGASEIVLSGEFDYQAKYDFEIWAEDKIYNGTTIKKNQTVTEGEPTFAVLPGGVEVNGTLQVNGADSYINNGVLPSGDGSNAYWQSLKAGSYFCSSASVISGGSGKPDIYGMVFIYKYGTETVILFNVQSIYNLYKMSMNGTTVLTPSSWKRLLTADDLELPLTLIYSGALITAGSVGTLSQSCTSTGYKYICVKLSSRVYNWTTQTIMIPIGTVTIGSEDAGSWITHTMSSYSENISKTIQFCFPTTTTVKIKYNSHPTGDNALRITNVYLSN